MTDERTTVMEITLIEGAHLADLVSQFLELLDEGGSSGTRPPDDPALARLVPDAYRGDADAAREFRALTASDLLNRRRDDARAVLDDLSPGGRGLHTVDLSPDSLAETLPVTLTTARGRAWLRTLNALRLVLATRLGIEDEDDHDAGDRRFAVYDWLGYRLDGLVAALGR